MNKWCQRYIGNSLWSKLLYRHPSFQLSVHHIRWSVLWSQVTTVSLGEKKIKISKNFILPRNDSLIYLHKVHLDSWEKLSFSWITLGLYHWSIWKIIYWLTSKPKKTWSFSTKVALKFKTSSITIALKSKKRQHIAPCLYKYRWNKNTLS